MSNARIEALKAEIDAQKQRQKDFSAYPESVAAAKRAEQAARDELAKLEDAEPKPKTKTKGKAEQDDEG